MKLAREFELPERQRSVLRKAIVLELIVIAFEISAIVLLYLVLGGSQAMKTAWIEDMLALVPPIVFLLATATRDWAPNDRYPYGYHRAVDLAFLAAAAALLAIGMWLLYEGVMALWRLEHPTLGTKRIGQWQPWLGWLAMPVLIYVAIVPAVLGRLLLKPARQIHDKVLFAGAKMLKADWLSSAAAIVGVLGIAVGWWWLDAVAAIAISISIIHDGVRNIRSVLGDLMDRRPQTVTEQPSPLPERVRQMLQSLDWVEDAEVRLREHGHVFFGEAFVIPKNGADFDLLNRIEEAVRQAYELDWRLQDLVIHPVPPHGRRTEPPDVRSELE